MADCNHDQKSVEKFLQLYTKLYKYFWVLLNENKCFMIAGNANMVYTIIRKRNVFHQLANLPIDHSSIAKALTKRGRGKVTKETSQEGNELSMEGSTPAAEAEPGTLKVSLAATPGR